MTDVRSKDLGSYRDLFAKLKRDAAAFAAIPTADALFNAMVTAWSLADWILEDVSASAPGMEHDLRLLVGKAPGDKHRDLRLMSQEMRLCQDLAIGNKHARISKYTPEAESTTPIDSVFGEAIFGFSTYGGPRRYAIKVGESLHDSQDVITVVVGQFEAFFARYDL